MIRKSIFLAATLGMMLTAPIQQARAEDDAASYPSKTVKIVVSTPPGSQQDTLGRMVAESLHEQMPSQPFIVQNVPGAGSLASAALVAHSPADGDTILIANAAPIGIAKSLRNDLSYNPMTDLAPVSQLTTTYFLVIVNDKKIAAKTLPELLALLKANPGKYNYASSGIGGMLHMQDELFMLRTGTKITHIPYKSAGEVATAVISGYVDMAVTTTDALQQVKSGQLKALAVTAPNRLPAIPDVPTMKEIIPSYGVASVWQGVFVPAATPRPIVDKLNKAIANFLKTPEIVERFKGMELIPSPNSPEKFSELVKDDATTWAEVIKTNGIEVHD